MPVAIFPVIAAMKNDYDLDELTRLHTWGILMQALPVLAALAFVIAYMVIEANRL